MLIRSYSYWNPCFGRFSVLKVLIDSIYNNKYETICCNNTERISGNLTSSLGGKKRIGSFSTATTLQSTMSLNGL